MAKRGVVVLSSGAEYFPEMLIHITRTPKQLYALGNTSLLSNPLKIGIVGTRKPTGYGLQLTTLFATKLAEAGAVIVSGMAYGVDSAAHLACINAGGKTIAVLGGGVDIIYPKANTRLYQQILDNDGLIVSEQPCGQVPLKGMFVQRNRIISGISQGVFIVEGTLQSGSMITAKYAVDQGKDVFVAPMPITSIQSAGPLSLFRDGARMVTSPHEILEEYGITSQELTKKLAHTSPLEKAILDNLSSRDLPLDALAQKTQTKIEEITFQVTSLELKGYIMKTIMGTYQRIK